jgi:hypothetical protein
MARGYSGISSGKLYVSSTLRWIGQSGRRSAQRILEMENEGWNLDGDLLLLFDILRWNVSQENSFL